MLKELKFVQGAVAKKELLPSLTHFCIEDGNVRSFNGILALNSPIQFDINCKPKAEPFVKAIGNCKEAVTLSMSRAGRLCVKSGSFKAFIPCVEEETPHITPEGERFELDGEALINALTIVEPFIGNDASRPFSNGVLVRGESAYATNNVTLVQYWIGSHFPFECNIPKVAIKELLRVGEPPIYGLSNGNSISFHYEDGRWIHTALLDCNWPDCDKILNRQGNPTPINEEIYTALECLKPFIDKFGRVYFTPTGIATSLEESEGASYTIPEFGYEGIYRLEILQLLKGRATSIDFTTYPEPCIFYGNKLRGALMGMRL